ncbi:TerD family protein [Arthrobacter oryzae]|uniref:TerD family protein n=2 Tax=Arthrobacter oryzae TaxID=409290 RepID=A0A3N0BMB1_9MICC|nr:TerD family protein [Arthrobacter oryzae]
MASMVAGSNAALTAENPDLGKVLLGIGWDTVPSRGPQSEPVPMVIMCGPDGRAVSDEHLVFFNQIASPEGSITFAGTEDQEQIDVDLNRVPDSVSKIAVLVYIDPDVRGPGTFGAVRNTYLRVADEENRELLRFDVPPVNMDKINAMILGELYRHGGGWKFRALGQGYETGLAAVAADFRLKL